MAEKEPSMVISEFFRKLADVAQRKADAEGITPDEARRRLIEKGIHMLEENPARPQASRRKKEKEVQTSKEFVQKSQSDKPEERTEAQRQAQSERYLPQNQADARQYFDDVQSALQGVGRDAPAWLDVATITHTGEAAQFAARVSMLPQELQNNPAVLYKEAARLYWSTEWSSISNEAAQEVRGVLDRTFAEVRRLQGNPTTAVEEFKFLTNDELIDGFDRRPDVYRTRRLAPVAAAGNPPRRPRGGIDKQHANYPDWVTRKIAEEQSRKLELLLKTYQTQLDSPTSGGDDKQRDLLEELTRKLRDGLTRDMRIEGIDESPTQYKSEDAQRYIDNAEQKINTLQKERQERLFRERKVIKWDEKLAEIYNNPDLKVGDVIDERFDYLTHDDIKKILYEGEDGQLEWVGWFKDRFIGSGGKPFEAGLVAQQMWEQFRHLVELANGRNNPALSQRYYEMFQLFEDVDNVVSAVQFRFTGEKPEELFRALRFITPKHEELLNRTEYIEIARPFFLESIEAIMTNEHSEVRLALEYLREETNIQHPHTNRNLRRIEVWKDFEKKLSEGTLNPGDMQELQNMREQIDRVAQGVLLRDRHMLPNTYAYDQSLRSVKQYQEVSQKLAHPDPRHPLSQDQIDELQRLQGKLRNEIEDQWYKVTLDKLNTLNADDPNATKEIIAVRNFSPVEIRTRERMLQHFRKELYRNHQRPGQTPPTEQEYQDYLSKNNWKIREAIWSAKALSVGTGEAMEKGAKLGKGSLIDLKYRLGMDIADDAAAREIMKAAQSAVKVKHFMNRGYAEAYQRVANPYLFADDFSMGGKMGDVSRDLFYVSAFRRSGYDLEKDARWNRKLREADKEGIPRWVIYTDYAQSVLGISYSEVLRPDLLATGLQNLSTNWRNAEAVLDPIRDEYLSKLERGELRAGASPEFQALGYRLAELDSKDLAGAERIIRLMMKRKSSMFFSMVGEDVDRILEGSRDLGLHGHDSGLRIRDANGNITSDWHEFQDALSHAEMELWRNEDLRWYEFDLTHAQDFNRIMPDALRAVGVAEADIPAKMRMHFTALSNMERYMGQTVANGETRFKNWATHNFRNLIVLTSSDFNWKKTEFQRIGQYSFARRINDFLGMNKARDLMYEVLHTSEFLMPAPGKEVDTLTKIKEAGQTVISYAGPDAMEKLEAALLEVVVEFNRNRAIEFPLRNWRGIFSWIPGAVSIMKRMGGISHFTEYLKESNPGFKSFLKEHKLLDVAMEKWPKSIAQAVSHAVVFQGPEGNAWDEYKIAGFLAGAETSVMFPNSPHLIAELNARFRSGPLWRMYYGVPRKYWWVIPVATIALASSQSLDEEKKSGGGHS